MNIWETTMRRTNGKWRHTSSKSATEQLFDLAVAAQNLLVNSSDAAEPRLVIHMTLLV